MNACLQVTEADIVAGITDQRIFTQLATKQNSDLRGARGLSAWTITSAKYSNFQGAQRTPFADMFAHAAETTNWASIQPVQRSSFMRLQVHRMLQEDISCFIVFVQTGMHALSLSLSGQAASGRGER